MAVSAHKKVLVSRFDREPVEGFAQSPESQADAIEVLQANGLLVRIPVSETKALCFVREFDEGETWKRHRSFAVRPKMAGLWVRLKFRDGELLEGILPNNLMQIEGPGFGIVPPDPTFQNQRIWVPRSALGGVEVLGVIGSPLKRRPAVVKTDDSQIPMFE